MEESDVVAALSSLGHVTRLRVFRALVVAGTDGVTPGELAEALALPAATLSFHLKELMNAGLSSQERDGRHLIYRADYARMNALLGYLTSHCCQGQACVPEIDSAALRRQNAPATMKPKGVRR